MPRPVRFTTFTRNLRVRLTPAQSVLALVAFDGVDPTELAGKEREIAEQLFGPTGEILQSARRVLCIVKGARAGGTYVFGALYSLWRLLVADLSTLAPGEQATALVVAPDTRLARQCQRFALGAVDEHAELARLVTSRTEDSFTLRREDGRTVAFEVLPATRGGSALRSRSLVSAVLSEVAFFRDAGAAVNDVDCFRAVVPRVLPGGMVVLESTPWLEQGLLHEEFVRNFAAPRTAIAALAPTLLMLDNERNRQVVAAERERDPDNARREFDAEFITGGAGLLFGPELLGPALERDLPLATKPEPTSRVTIGGDIGLVKDASAFVAIHRRGTVLTVADALELRPRKGAPLKLSEVVRDGCAFAARHGSKTIHVDHHVLEPAREHLPNGFHLSPVAGGQEAKADRFLETRKAFREGNIRVCGPLAKLCVQLGCVIGRAVPGGGTQIVLPRRAGTHLDLAAAFIVAAWAALHAFDLGPFTQRAGARERFARHLGGY
jgi:hypothetical protein